jgi:hypothetical protein
MNVKGGRKEYLTFSSLSFIFPVDASISLFREMR